MIKDNAPIEIGVWSIHASTVSQYAINPIIPQSRDISTDNAATQQTVRAVQCQAYSSCRDTVNRESTVTPSKPIAQKHSDP